MELSSNPKKYVRRNVDARNNVKHKTKMVKFGGQLMLWGCIKSDGKGKLLKADGSLNSENVISLLRSNLVTDNDDGYISQHDSTLCNASRSAKRLLVDEDLQFLEDWSIQSTTFDTIEPF